MIELIRRQEATEATIARYDGKALAWGRNDCVRMVSRHLRNMGARVSILKGRRYNSALGAARTLKGLGFTDLPEGMDSLGYDRIPPAAAIIGDVLALPSGNVGNASMMVAVGNGRAFGMLRDEEANVVRFGVVQPALFITAWRVI